jgi:hypothetical protein
MRDSEDYLAGSKGWEKAHTAAKHLHEMCDKSRNVFPALSQRWQQDGEDIQTPLQAPHTIATTCLLTYQVPLGPF